jgi:hypothetical protein
MSTTPKKSKDFASVVRKTGQQLGKKLKATAQAAGKAAGKTAEVVGVRAKVSTKQVKVKAEFLKIGEAYYRARKSGMNAEQCAASVQPQVQKVDGLNQEIAALQRREKTLRASR